ncbi:MAG: TonB-dependent receptor domain-containing protein [Gemmatimonadales bacterium]
MSAALLGVCVSTPLRATRGQGVAGAAVQGAVVSASGSPVANARVTLTNQSTGNIQFVITGDRGLFAFENASVGGPYSIEARAIGFEPAAIEGIILHLGDRITRTIALGAQRVQRLENVLVRGSTLRDAGAGGPAYAISGEAVRNLPLLNRDFVGLFAMAPQATGASALSVGGQNQRFNAIQVDGGASRDFYGVGVTPGVGAGANLLSLESLEEIRILVAPFDVRQGGFSGGLINAVTRSGTNQLRGSTFVSLSRAALVGADTAGAAIQSFQQAQYGLNVGGPIVKDRLHFFVAADLQAREHPYTGPATSDPATGVSDATARRAQKIFQDEYGFDPGGPQSPALEQPDRSVFLKLSWQPSASHRIELTQNWVDAQNDTLIRTVRTPNATGSWQLSSSGFGTIASNRTTRLRAASIFGSASNELIAGYTTISLGRQSRSNVPLFLVQADLVGTYIAGGSVASAQGTETDQRVIEFTDNLTWTAGSHLLTAGVQDLMLHFSDNFFSGSWGSWTFDSVDSLERRLPSLYTVSLPLPLRPDGPIADFSVNQLAAYAQDRWSVAPRLTLTGGVRIDVPFFQNTPLRNGKLASDAALGDIDTGVFPSGNGVISPRVGFSLDVGRDHDTKVRGGVGGFAGQPPYVWLAGAYMNTGQEQATLKCDASKGVPAPTSNIAQLPQHCLNSGAASPTSTINYVAPDFRFQQAWKYEIGIDHDFGHGLTASVDFIETRTMNTLFMRDVNLVEQGTDAEGRFMYGTITTSAANTALIHTAKIDSAFGQVFLFENRSADRSSAITTELQQRWASGTSIQVGYNWSSAQDLMSVSGLNSAAISGTNPIDGSMSSRALRRSARDIPNNLVVTAIVPMRFGITAALYFRARSGTPYAYVLTGDANADGVKGDNDLVYVPRNSNDVSLVNPAAYSALDAFIESEPCLRRQRGHLMARNSCRNPAVQSLDVRLAKTTRVWGTRGVEIAADIFNLPNLLYHGWGLARETTSGEALELLQVSGWDAGANRPRYTIPNIGGVPVFPSRNHVLVDASRWRMQLGARYNF